MPAVCSNVSFRVVSTFIQYALGWGGLEKRVLFARSQKAENCGPPLRYIALYISNSTVQWNPS